MLSRTPFMKSPYGTLLVLLTVTVGPLWLAGTPARSEVIKDLYQGRAIVTGQGEETRGPGLSKALMDVLVKVSGDPTLRHHAAALRLARTPGPYVQAIGYHDRMEGIPLHDEQGTRERPYDLIVDFSPTAIDGLLQGFHRKPWAVDRPVIAVLVRMTMNQNSYLLSDHGPRGHDPRASLMDGAWLVGLGTRLPSTALLDTLPSDPLNPQAPAALSAALGTPNSLTGTLLWDQQDLSWTAHWSLTTVQGHHRWTIRGVNYDSAFRNALRASAQVLSGQGTSAMNADRGD